MRGVHQLHQGKNGCRKYRVNVNVCLTGIDGKCRIANRCSEMGSCRRRQVLPHMALGYRNELMPLRNERRDG